MEKSNKKQQNLPVNPRKADCLKRAHFRVIVISWKEALQKELLSYSILSSFSTLSFNVHSFSSFCHLRKAKCNPAGRVWVVIKLRKKKFLLIWSSRQRGVKIHYCVDLVNWEIWEPLKNQEFSLNLGGHSQCFAEVQASGDRTRGLPWSPDVFNHF